MLEIAIISLIVVLAVVLFLRRPKKPGTNPDDKGVVYTCPHCGAKDCHCERKS